MDDMIPVFDIIPVASRYHDIHPYSAMNIDSVEINVFQKMKTIKDWNVSFRQHLHILHDENHETRKMSPQQHLPPSHPLLSLSYHVCSIFSIGSRPGISLR